MLRQRGAIGERAAGPASRLRAAVGTRLAAFAPLRLGR